jgi:hypothetical protein
MVEAFETVKIEIRSAKTELTTYGKAWVDGSAITVGEEIECEGCC